MDEQLSTEHPGRQMPARPTGAEIDDAQRPIRSGCADAQEVAVRERHLARAASDRGAAGAGRVRNASGEDESAEREELHAL
jgi:hypothetical protein